MGHISLRLRWRVSAGPKTRPRRQSERLCWPAIFVFRPSNHGWSVNDAISIANNAVATCRTVRWMRL